MSWLIFAAKYSRSDYAVWWRPESCGYTTDLNDAGRYTEAEAKARHRAPDHIAVRLADVEAKPQRRVVLTEHVYEFTGAEIRAGQQREFVMRIAGRREGVGKTVEELARRLGVAASVVKAIEGDRLAPTDEQVSAIAQFLHNAENEANLREYGVDLDGVPRA